jgi:hypothetical protein
MSFGLDYPKIGSANPITGQNLYTVIDTYNTALENNGAQQPLGSIYQAPLNPAVIGTAANGSGLNAYYKYVRYNPTVTQALKTGPVLTYWKDETFTTTTGLASEALSLDLPAGWMLYNTTTLSSATAAQINGNFCWILVGGFLPGAWVTNGTAVGGAIIPSGTTFGATGYIAPSTNITDPVVGRVLTVAASNLSDLYVPFLN